MEKIIEKLQNCIYEVQDINFEDYTALDSLIDRTKMYMSKLDPENNAIKTLGRSMFTANLVRDTMWGTNILQFKKAWDEGKVKYKNLINNFIEEYNLDKDLQESQHNSPKEPEQFSHDIFIIHGHDNEMKLNVARTVEKLGLNPIILHEQEDKGRTIIEKFEHLAKNSGYAIALLSPDDVCVEEGKEKRRARQNVIFELGYFTGLLGRERTLALIRGINNIELLSDYQGIIYKEYDQSETWKFLLAKELKAVGYNITVDSIL